MYPIWLLAGFLVGTLDCLPVKTVFDTCPHLKTSKLVHGDFLTGCVKKNTGTVSDKLCTLYEEILRQLCASVKDNKLPFTDADIDKAVQSTDILKVCQTLSTFKVDDVARTKEILLPIADVHCFHTCQNDDFKTLPICNYGAYILNFTNVLASERALEDSNHKGAKENASVIDTPKAVEATKGSNVIASPSASGGANVVNKGPLHLQPRISNDVLENTDDSKPLAIPVPKNNPKIETAPSNGPNKISKPQEKPLDGLNVGSKAGGQVQAVPKEDEPKKNGPNEEAEKKGNNESAEGVPVKPKATEDVGTIRDSVISKAPVNEGKIGDSVKPEVARNEDAVGASGKSKASGENPEKPADPQQPEPPKEEKAKPIEPKTTDAENPQGVVANSGVNGVDVTAKEQNSQGKKKDVVEAEGQNPDLENPQEQLEDNDFDDEDNNLESPDDININNEPPKTTNQVNPEPVEKKPVKTEYSEQDIMPHSYKTENTDDGDSYFFSYFMAICVVFIGGYVIYHNKQRILALILEGRKGRRGSRSRRPNSANYKKLDSNLEEAISSSCNKSATHVIY